MVRFSFCPSDLSFKNYHIHKTKQQKKIYIPEKVIIRLTLNPKNGYKTILPCFWQVNLTWARDPIGKPALGQRSALQKHLTSMSCKLEPAIWSYDTGQRNPCFDRCQLIMVWMSNINKVHGKPRLCLSFGVWPPCWATPSSSSSSCVRAHEQYR